MLGRIGGRWSNWSPRRVPYRALVVLLGLGGFALYAASEVFGTANRPEARFAELIVSIAVVVIVGRAVGEVVARFGQPRVMGEVLGGILLGPSLVGAFPTFFPALCGASEFPCAWPFSMDAREGLTAGAEIGLVFYMFLVGLELDPAVIRERARQAIAISLTSVALPFTLGIGAAVVLLGEGARFGDATRPLAFTVFMGVSMSITAFPVLARILIERRMIRGPIGSLALACAAIDDVMAWTLLALATAFAVSGGGAASPGAPPAAVAFQAPDPVIILILAVAFCLVMAVLARPVVARVAEAYDEAGHVPAAWIVAILVGILLAAFLSQRVGIAAIFGAFLLGLIMPRRSGLTEDIGRRLEDFVVIILLPLFFVVSGLRTDISSLIGQPDLWGWTVLLIVIAVGGKWLGAYAAARLSGIDRRGSMAMGALMNTRGLTELIVLNVGLSLGVITQDLFTMLVVMAVVTTFMAGPALRIIDRRGALTVMPEAELERAAPPTPPRRAILVACQDAKNLASLVTLARALASRGEPREVILVRLLQLSRLTTRYTPHQTVVAAATDELRVHADQLIASGIPARSVALTSARLGEDLLRLARDERIDLVLSDGRRSLVADGLPGGPVGSLLEEAACDVAVLIERQQAIAIDPAKPIIVPFGGSEHDWAAVEVAALIADANGARLRLLGVTAPEESRDAGGLLASAALAVQGISGVTVEPVLLEHGGESVLLAAADASLLVVGLSSRWRQEGLGPVRRAIALEALVPTLFVRRGTRGGVLAPADTFTDFRWSAIGTPET